jgi:hypothetical protein
VSDFRLYEPHECGKDGYPFAWHESLKQTVRERVGHRCERCKHPYECGKHGTGEWTPCDYKCTHDRTDCRGVEAHWRILTVHHLDGNKANCEAWNLAALCQKCHLTVQGRVKMDQMFFTELLDVSEWFKPHLQGYLASQGKAGVESA